MSKKHNFIIALLKNSNYRVFPFKLNVLIKPMEVFEKTLNKQKFELSGFELSVLHCIYICIIVRTCVTVKKVGHKLEIDARTRCLRVRFDLF